MSSEPRMTASTTLTAATTSAARSAQPKLSTREHAVGHVQLGGDRRIRASAISTSRKPSTSVSGNRSAARTGGMTAFSAATIAATTSAPQKLSMSTPGRIAGGHHQGDARGEPRDEEREQPQAGALGLPGCGLAVGRLGVAGHLALLLRARMTDRPRLRCRGGDGTGLARTLRAPPSSPPSSRRAAAFCSATLTFASAYDCADELLAALPAEDRDDEHDREEDVPGGRDQLLRGGVVDRDALRRRRSRCRARARSSPA